MKEIYLDLQEVDLYGWERYKSQTLVDSLLRGIAMGDVFPPVPVVQNDGFYSLDSFAHDARFSQSDIREGGHTRAIAHYLARKSLRCVLTGVSQLPSPPEGFFLIREISVTDSYGEGNKFFGKIDLRSGAIHKMACDTRYR